MGKFQIRLPFKPLMDAAGVENHTQAAHVLGMDYRTICRYLDEGVPNKHADRLACHLGYHPTNIWGAAWEEAEDVYYHRPFTREEKTAWRHMERRWRQWRTQHERWAA